MGLPERLGVEAPPREGLSERFGVEAPPGFAADYSPRPGVLLRQCLSSVRRRVLLPHVGLARCGWGGLARRFALGKAWAGSDWWDCPNASALKLHQGRDCPNASALKLLPRGQALPSPECRASFPLIGIGAALARGLSSCSQGGAGESGRRQQLPRGSCVAGQRNYNAGSPDGRRVAIAQSLCGGAGGHLVRRVVGLLTKPGRPG